MASKVNLAWNTQNILDRTRFANNGQPPVQFTENDTVVTRHERERGDDFPAIRVIANHSITSSLSWEVRILKDNGFCEVGVYCPTEKIAYFLKPSRNEVQSELPVDQFKTTTFGQEQVNVGDTVKVEANVYHSENGQRVMRLNFYKNGNLMGEAFNEIHICDHQFFPMVGVNDEGDSIALCN